MQQCSKRFKPPRYTNWKSCGGVIGNALEPGSWFLGETYSLCDMPFVMQAVWVENQPPDLTQFANSARLMKAAFERPAVQRVVAIHQIEHLTAI